MRTAVDLGIYKVFRVEHFETGIGPYTDKGTIDFHLGLDLIRAHNNSQDHPGPVQEGLGELLESCEEYRFGFEDLESLRTWFSGWIERLHAAGYLIAVYEVPATWVIFGSKQCIFHPDFVENVYTIGLDTLFE